MYLLKNNYLSDACKNLILAAISEEDEQVTYLANVTKIIYGLCKQNRFYEIEHSLLRMKGWLKAHNFTEEINEYSLALKNELGNYLKTVGTIDKLIDRNTELKN